MSNSTHFTDSCSAQSAQQLDQTFEVLTDPHRRHALSYLIAMEGDITSVTDLLKAIGAHTSDSTSAPDSDDGDQRLRFHRIHLPKLDATGLIDYDARSETVRYHSHPSLEQVLALTDELEGTD